MSQVMQLAGTYGEWKPVVSDLEVHLMLRAYCFLEQEYLTHPELRGVAG